MAKQPQVCSLPWCRQSGSHLTFHKFPSEQIRQMQWLTLLDVDEIWKDVSHWKISTYSICSLHFGLGGTVRRATTPLVTTSHIPSSTPIKISSKSQSRQRKKQLSLLSSASPQPNLNIQNIAHTMRQQVETRSSSRNIVQSRAKRRSFSNESTEINNKKEKIMSTSAPQLDLDETSNSSTQPSENDELPSIETLTNSSASNTRESFSLAKKVEVIRALQSGMKQAEVFRTMKLHRSTVNHFWRNREKILKAFQSTVPSRKRVRKGRFGEVDTALYEWYISNVASQNGAVTGRHLQTAAEKIAEDFGLSEFVCNGGWIERFKQRYGIRLTPSKKKIDEDLEELSSDHVNGTQQVTENHDPHMLGVIKPQNELDDSQVYEPHIVPIIKTEISSDEVNDNDEENDYETDFLLQTMENSIRDSIYINTRISDHDSEDVDPKHNLLHSPMMSDPLEITTDHYHPTTTASESPNHIEQTFIIKQEMEQEEQHPMSLLSPSEIQFHLEGLKIWMTTRDRECPQVVLEALSTLESFTHSHLS